MISKLTFKLLSAAHRRGKVAGMLLIIILALDLHRYGAWYMGNQSYIKPHWIPILVIVSTPFVLYLFGELVRRKSMPWITGFLVGLIWFLIWLAIGYYKQDFNAWDWMDRGCNILYTSKSMIKFIIMGIITAACCFIAFTDKKNY